MLRWCTVAVAAAGFIACGGEEAPKRTTAKKVQNTEIIQKKKKEAPVAAPPSDAPQYVYSAVGKKDPFRSYLERAGKDKEDDGRQRKREPTEKYELDQYRLTGLITGTSQLMALVKDPKGRGHTLRINSRLGKNGGKVTRITSTGLVVTEEFRAPTGERIKVPISILLPVPDLGLLTE